MSNNIEDGWYVKLPVEIFAQQYHPGKVIEGVCTGECEATLNSATPHIHTLEGKMDVIDGDVIITGIKGEKYPCKVDIFVGSYDTENFKQAGNNAV